MNLSPIACMGGYSRPRIFELITLKSDSDSLLIACCKYVYQTFFLSMNSSFGISLSNSKGSLGIATGSISARVYKYVN
jgi:hypothetical protein